MILPQTSGMVWILMALSLLCWGSWANTFKLAGKYRFEAYYLDFAVGFLAIALICAFTVGSLGFDGFLFLDDMEHAGKRQWLFGFIAGVIFNLGNMLLTSSISVGGMAVAFPSAIGMAIIVSSLLSFITKPVGNLLILVCGCLMIAGAIGAVAAASNILGIIRHEVLARAGKAKSTRRPTSFKPVILAVAGGLLLGLYFPLVQRATDGDVGLGPYSVMVVFAIGVFFSTPVFDIFFMNLPVEGEPLEFTALIQARLPQHLLGVLGGAIWCTGSVAALAASFAPAGTHASPGVTAWMSQAYPLLAAVWGLLWWKEFRQGDARVKICAVTMLILFAGGLVLVAAAPQYLLKG